MLQAILTVMGLSKSSVNDADTLSRLGIDSMQMVEASPSKPLDDAGSGAAADDAEQAADAGATKVRICC